MANQLSSPRRGIVIALMASVSVAACQTTNEGAGTGLGALLGAAVGGALGGKKGALIGAAAGALAGNRIGAYLDARDREALNNVTAQNIEGMKDGETVTWTNPDKELSVDVTAEATDSMTREVAVVRFKDVENPEQLDVIGAAYEVTSDSAYVFSSPGVGGQILDEIDKGTGVWVIGSVPPDGEWLYVERDGFAIGYVAAADIAAGTDDAAVAREPSMRQAVNLETADDEEVKAHMAERGIDTAALGGDQVVDTFVASSTCRDIKYNLKAKDADIEEKVRACKAGDGAWEVVGAG